MGEYVVVGSGLLDALGIRDATDIDVAVSQKLLKKLQATRKYKEEWRYNKLFLVGDKIDVITQLNWDKYPTTVEKAIETAIVIDGVPFMNIDEMILFKIALGREKDFKDVELMKKYKNENTR